MVSCLERRINPDKTVLDIAKWNEYCEILQYGWGQFINQSVQRLMRHNSPDKTVLDNGNWIVYCVILQYRWGQVGNQSKTLQQRYYNII